jgi:hypothetical protein
MVVTLDENRSPSLLFNALDVIRWEKITIDMNDFPDLTDPYLLVDEITLIMQSLLHDSDGRALAVRVEIFGSTGLHSKISASPQHWMNEIRRAALETGGGEIWVENVHFSINPEKERKSMEDAWQFPPGSPVNETIRCLEQLKTDTRLTKSLKNALSDLFKKLPPELKQGENSLVLDRADKLEKLVDQVGPILITRLLEKEKSGNAS